MNSILPLKPAGLGLIPGFPPKNSEAFILDAANDIRWRWLDESGQWFENVDLNPSSAD